MTAPVIVGLLVLATSAALSGGLLLPTRARLTGGLLIAGSVLLTAGVSVWGIEERAGTALLIAALSLCWVPALLAYPSPEWRHPLSFCLWVAAVAAGALATTSGGTEPAMDTAGVVLLLAVTGHVLWRLERAADADRTALLWLAFATTGAGIPYGVAVFTVAQLPSRLFGLTLAALVAPLLVVGIRRPLMVDVRGLVTEAVVLGTAMIAYMCLFIGVTTGLEMAGVTDLQLGALAVIGALAAAGFHPLRLTLRAAVDELLFGERPDPLDAATRVAGQIGDDPALALDAILQALVLPYASLQVEGEEVAAAGTPVTHTRRIPLSIGEAAGGEGGGELIVGLRPGDLNLSPGDERVLRITAPLLTQILRARSLAADLQVSRGQAIAAIEDERRRLRRDLHDGLGPTLSGIAFTADAARNSLAADPGSADELLRGLRADAVAAIGEVRRLVYAMRPPALDELGLVPALRQWTLQVRTADGRPLRVDVDAPDDLADLPAAVEVAAYRITVEALTNVARHSGCDRAAVRLALAADHTALTVEVSDEGGPAPRPWSAGVGLSSMRERSAEIGGTLTARPAPTGGQVTAVLPLG